MDAQTSNPSVEEVKAGGSGAQVTQGYMRLCLKNTRVFIYNTKSNSTEEDLVHWISFRFMIFAVKRLRYTTTLCIIPEILRTSISGLERRLRG